MPIAIKLRPGEGKIRGADETSHIIAVGEPVSQRPPAYSPAHRSTMVMVNASLSHGRGSNNFVER